jgi:copper(I)-binding protein
MRPRFALAFAAAIASAVSPAVGQQFNAGDITIDQPWARSTPKGASVGGGYLTISNAGAQPDTLLGGSADFCGAVQVHQMSMTGGVMRMRQLTAGLEIPAKGRVALTPGGYHLMFFGLKRPLVKGETVKVALSFAHAGTVPVDFKVAGIGDMGPGGASKPDATGMKGMKM